MVRTSDSMRRRNLVAGALSLFVARPASLAAQQARMPKVAVLALGSPSPTPFWETFKEAMRELRYVEGQNIVFELHSANGNAPLLPELATKLARDKVDVIVAYQTPAATSAKQATTTIPVVMSGVGDPIGTGLVSNLSWPGGNVTGSSAMAGQVAGKNLELIREMIPGARRVAVLANASDPFTKPFLAGIEGAAATLGFEVRPFMVQPAAEFDAAFAEMQSDKFPAVMVQPSLLRPRVYELLLKYRIPSNAPIRSFAENGGLMSFGQNQRDAFRQAAFYVDRILKGAKPGDLPIQQPTTFELVINVKTAKSLGLTVPTALLARADELID